MSLIEDIEEFTAYHLPLQSGKSSKELIHDTISGLSELEDYEIEILDTPLLQRLRYISQMGFVHLLYPQAIHSRFQHTVGVVTQTAALANEIRKKKPRLVDDIAIRELRLAALMHDSGHGIFSHSSEDYYRDYPEWDPVHEVYQDTGGAAPHETLSALIVRSDAFARFFRNLERKYDIALNLDEVARCIIGISYKSQAFKAAIINGPLDADKSDYLLRDAYNLGISCFYRPDILEHQIEVSWVGDTRNLVVPIGSVDAVEAALFSKLILFSSVYSHHVVRACECSFKGIIDYCRETGVKIGNRDLDRIIDFLWLSEHSIIDLGKITNDTNLKRLVDRIAQRRLLKTAILLSTITVKDHIALMSIQKLSIDDKRRIARDIWYQAGKPCLLQEIWLDVPPLPSLDAYNSVSVVLYDGTSVPLIQLFPSEQWVRSFMQYKWRGYIFCPDDCVQEVSSAAMNVLRNQLSISLDDNALIWRRSRE